VRQHKRSCRKGVKGRRHSRPSSYLLAEDFNQQTMCSGVLGSDDGIGGRASTESSCSYIRDRAGLEIVLYELVLGILYFHLAYDGFSGSVD
jgi:hypothetical protein